MRPKLKIKNELFFSFIFIICFALTINYFTSTVIFNSQYFSHDLRNSALFEIIAKYINSTDFSETNNFSEETNRELISFANIAEAFYQIKDTNGNVLLESDNEDYLLGKFIESNKSYSFISQKLFNLGTPNLKLTKKLFPLFKEGKLIGYVTIGSINTWLNLSNYFSYNANISVVISLVFAIFFSIILAFINSRKIALPLMKIAHAIDKIRRGNYKIRTQVKAYSREITTISESLNGLAEALGNQEKLRNRLSTDIVHEIKTPLTIVKHIIEAIEDGVLNLDINTLHDINSELMRVNNIVDNLNKLSKLEQVDSNLALTKFNLSEELENFIEAFKPLYNNKNIKLEKFITPGISINMDKAKFKEIVQNILSNAYRYTNNDGKVKIFCTVEHGKAVLKVVDTGIGISNTDLPYIFERFYRAEESRNSQTGGTGIGLAIVKAFVKAHNGEINVQSELGKGTTFTVSLNLV